MRATGRSRRGLPMRVVRHVLGGLLTGAVVGYLAALILPRRYPAPAGTYQAPIPPQADLLGDGTDRDRPGLHSLPVVG